MKRKFFALVALMACFTLGANAQFYAGGSVGFTSSKLSNNGHDEDGSSFKLMPEFGYKLDKDISIGVQIGYSHGYAAFGSLSVTDFKAAATNIISTYADISEDDTKLNSFTFAPYVRYNVLNLGKANIFLEGAIGYISASTDGTPKVNGKAGNETKMELIDISVRPGISYQLNDCLSAVAKLGQLGYMTGKEKESDMKISRFGLELDSYNILLGLNFHF